MLHEPLKFLNLLYALDQVIWVTFAVGFDLFFRHADCLGHSGFIWSIVPESGCIPYAGVLRSGFF